MAEVVTKEQKLSRLETRLKELKVKHNEFKIKKNKAPAEYVTMRAFKVRMRRIKAKIRRIKGERVQVAPPVVITDAFRAKKLKQIEESIGIIKGQVEKLKAKGPNDPLFRQVRKKLKRFQRRYAILKPVTIEEKLARMKKMVEILNGKLEALKKKGKKPGNAYFNSLSSKIKSFNKKIKKCSKIIEKKQKAAAPAGTTQPT